MSKLDLIDKNVGWHKYSCCRINANNSFKHESSKFRLAYKLLKEGHKIGTEVKLTNGRIVDLVDYTDKEFYEFELNSEVTKEGAITIRLKKD